MRTLCVKHSMTRQQGKSLIGWLFTMMIAILLIQIVVKLSPAYLQSYYVEDILKRLPMNHTLSDMPLSDVQETLNKSFMLNNIGSAASGALKMRRVDDNVLITMDYEERISFFANIDVVLSFQHHLDSSIPEQCCKPQ